MAELGHWVDLDPRPAGQRLALSVHQQGVDDDAERILGEREAIEAGQHAVEGQAERSTHPAADEGHEAGEGVDRLAQGLARAVFPHGEDGVAAPVAVEGDRERAMGLARLGPRHAMLGQETPGQGVGQDHWWRAILTTVPSCTKLGAKHPVLILRQAQHEDLALSLSKGEVRGGQSRSIP